MPSPEVSLEIPDMTPSFVDLELDKTLLSNLVQAGYETPTPIQQQAIPLILGGRDVLGIAQTGTGKTAAFALPILDRLIRDQQPRTKKCTRVLILSPTRELAGQIADNFRLYARGKKVRMTLVVGGKSMNEQIKALSEGVDVLVATPGRLMDHVGQKTLRLDQVDMAVVDEADQMMDMGFVHKLKRIAKLLPKQRQTLFFSATMPKAIRQIADQFLTKPADVQVTPAATAAPKIRQKILMVEKPNKRKAVTRILRSDNVARTIIFVRTKHGVDALARHLKKEDIPAVVLHGNRSQNQRNRALEDFKKNRVNVLVATDVAARGIDVDGISHVINMDLPNVADTYVHRIGRTARAGASGAAISLVSTEEFPYLRSIEKLLKTKLEAVAFDGTELVEKKPETYNPVSQPDAEEALPSATDKKPNSSKRKRKHRKGSPAPDGAPSARGKPGAKGRRGNKPFVKGGKPAAKKSGKASGKTGTKTSFGKPVQPKNKPQRSRRPSGPKKP